MLMRIAEDTDPVCSNTSQREKKTEHLCLSTALLQKPNKSTEERRQVTPR